MLVRSRPWLIALTLGAACGGRTGLDHGPALRPVAECAIDADCAPGPDRCVPRACQIEPVVYDSGMGGEGGSELLMIGRCVDRAPIDCDDNDPCTADGCDGATGLCAYAPATLDLDNDGHRAPRPGFLPGAPDACGDDCDDSNDAAFPGNPETCDGVDNDCNGVVDDNASFIPLSGAEQRISGDIAPSGTGGLAWSGDSYAAAYWGTDGGLSVYLSTITPTGDVISPPGEQPITLVNADASGGPLVWVGDRYGLAWQDRRSGSYEVFFTILDSSGAKKHADTQLTFAEGFSVNVSLTWNMSEFVVVWQDDRFGPFNIFAQRVSVDGVPIGSNAQLTNGLGNEAPSAAAGFSTLGVASGLGDASSNVIAFQTFALDLVGPASPEVRLTDGSTEAVYPMAVWNKDRYVIAWYDRTASPAGIYAATVSEEGQILTPAKPVTFPGAARSRYPFLRPLGDRVLLVYSDDRDMNQGYEIYSRMLSPTLDPLTPELRVTSAPRDSIYPIAAFGPQGNVGILFRDDRELTQNVYFTRLGCVAGP